MRRPLALVLAASIPCATALAAEPLDMRLSGIGAPTPEIWAAYGAADPAAAAAAAQQRFAVLTSELSLALSQALLEPASTTGHSGFDIAFEVSYGGVHPKPIGAPVTDGGGTTIFPAVGPYPTHTLTPYELTFTSIHIRKALPFSVEVGGRLTYLSQSDYYGGQLEAKWAVSEGATYLPDVAIRGALTHSFGDRDLSLYVAEADLLVSKRFGVMGVVSLTPYGAARFSFTSASSGPLYFGAGIDPPGTTTPTFASFPKLTAQFYRTTLGVRMTAYALSLAAEATYFGGADVGGGSSAYAKTKIASSWGGAGRFGFEF